MIFKLPGSSNSRILRPLRRSCSSSLASRSRRQYFSCSASAFQCSSEQCDGHPQSGHSNATACGCAWACAGSCSPAHTGQGASCLMASPRARTGGNGDFENGWKRLSSVNNGTCSSFCCFFGRKKENMWRVGCLLLSNGLTRERAGRRRSIWRRKR